MKTATEYGLEFEMMSMEQLMSVIDIACSLYKTKQVESDIIKCSTFAPGMKVKVMDSVCKGKGDRLFGKTGEVIKVGRSRVQAKFENEIWGFSPTMLEVVR